MQKHATELLNKWFIIFTHYFCRMQAVLVPTRPHAYSALSLELHWFVAELECQLFTCPHHTHNGVPHPDDPSHSKVQWLSVLVVHITAADAISNDVRVGDLQDLKETGHFPAMTAGMYSTPAAPKITAALEHIMLPITEGSS
jgi:hypothetical protein